MKIEIKSNVSLATYTTFQIGGIASYFTECKEEYEIKEALFFAKERGLPYLVLGKGSNSLFSDEGFKGLVILNRLSEFHQENTLFKVGAGFSFSLLGTKTARLGFSGLEFASGIPGSVGGAVWMNAGANGAETADHLTEVRFMTEEGEIKSFKREELTFSYRSSPFQKIKGAILSASFSLVKASGAREKQMELIEKRKRTQPLKEPSAGCVFRNPKDCSAGALIESCGLKGVKVGGAEVSTLHGNFIVNKGGATSHDVLSLARRIREEVKEKTGIELELELHRIEDV